MEVLHHICQADQGYSADIQVCLRKKVKGYLRGYISSLSFGCCREKLRQTYEFALDHVGIDFHSGSVWLDFIAFIKEE